MSNKELAPLPLVGALEPAISLEDQLASLRELAIAGGSENTERSYTTAMTYWASWFEARFRMPFPEHQPLDVHVIQQFILDHFQRLADGKLIHDLPLEVDTRLVAQGIKRKLGPLKFSTVRHRIVVLSVFNRKKRFDANPVLAPSVQETLTNVARSIAKRLGDAEETADLAPRQMAAMELYHLERILETCDGDDLRDVRDRAILSVAWNSGGRRRSEISKMKISHLRREVDGSYRWSLGQTKANQAGRQGDNAAKVIAGPAAIALDEWLARSGITEGFVFRGVRKSTVPNGEFLQERQSRDRARIRDGALTGNAIYEMVKARAAAAGLDPERLWGAHSIRAGWITEATRQGFGTEVVMKGSDHKDERSFRLYVDAEVMIRSGVSNLQGNSRKRR